MVHRASGIVLVRRPAPRALGAARGRLMTIAGMVVMVPAIVTLVIASGCADGNELAQEPLSSGHCENKKHKKGGDRDPPAALEPFEKSTHLLHLHSNLNL